MGFFLTVAHIKLSLVGFWRRKHLSLKVGRKSSFQLMHTFLPAEVYFYYTKCKNAIFYKEYHKRRENCGIMSMPISIRCSIKRSWNLNRISILQGKEMQRCRLRSSIQRNHPLWSDRESFPSSVRRCKLNIRYLFAG